MKPGMTNDAEKLKPCPFCGCAAWVRISRSEHDRNENDYWITCSNNRCATEGPVRKTKRGAIAAWDRRAK